MNNTRKYLLEGIVVALVLVVLLIVIFPRFMNAQSRMKINRIFFNLDHTRKAINAYYTDHSQYPVGMIPKIPILSLSRFTPRFDFVALTTPISYIGNPKYLLDPFRCKVKDLLGPYFDNFIYSKKTGRLEIIPSQVVENPQYLLVSWGVTDIPLPIHKVQGIDPSGTVAKIGLMYCPTNGVYSAGFFYATDQGVIPVE